MLAVAQLEACLLKICISCEYLDIAPTDTYCISYSNDIHHHIQNTSGTHPASYPMGSGGSFLEDKVARA